MSEKHARPMSWVLRAALLAATMGAGPLWDSTASNAAAEITLPAILGDGMVLQQNTDAPVWGWARPGEVVTVDPSWPGPGAGAIADDRGRWLARVRTPEVGGQEDADAGPFTLTISGTNTIVLRDILVGEVWVCAGQSNMEWPVGGIGPGRGGREGIPSAEQEVAAADFPRIRLFTIANTLSAHPQRDTRGAWAACGPESVKSFSAVGYFFGRAIHRELGVPIGLVSADWGGTPAEAWMSEGALMPFPEFAEALAFLDAARDPDRRATHVRTRVDAWWAALDTRGANAPGAGWVQDGFDDSGWPRAALPASLSGGEGEEGGVGLEQFDGVVYYRKVVRIPDAWDGRSATLELGPIDDRDEAWVNGLAVGATREDARWSVPRVYPVPASAIRKGSCTIAVRVLDTGGIGGINGRPEQMALRSDDASLPPIPLAGEWAFKVGPSQRDLPPIPPPQSTQMGPHTPGVLFNGMIAPLTNLAVRGVIWCQGESNVGRGKQYRALFPALIADWRSRFGQQEMPFYYVQIAPFTYGGGGGGGQDGGTRAAELREAQLMALSTPGTGMVVTTDLGNPRDIHPDNKQEVGRRLALWALAETYDRTDVVPSGPLYRGAWGGKEGMTVEGDTIRLRFDHADGLHARGGAKEEEGGDLTHFLIAGADQQFVRAHATIDGRDVVVSSPKVRQPVAVRYAWGVTGSGEAPNLYNGGGRDRAGGGDSGSGGGGLPASPFRTDDWSGPLPPVDDGGSTEFLTDEPGFVPLFNGRDLTGWTNVNCAPSTWTAADGAIVCSGVPIGLLRTEALYENFILELEWRHLKPGGNAGLFVWSDALPVRGQPFTRSVEVQIMDGLEGAGYTSDGDIFPIHGATMTPENGRGNGNRAFPTEKRMNPSPEWNHYRVTCRNGDISLAVNGTIVTRGRAASPRRGYICLESEGSPIHFRNLKIKELPASDPPLPPEQIAALDEGFRSLYTGVGFAGWTHTPDHEGHWKADDWTMASDGQGPDLWTAESYDDFILICDWRWTGKPTQTDRPIILPSGEEVREDDGTLTTRSVPDAGDSGIFLRGDLRSQLNIWCWPIGSGEVWEYRTFPRFPPDVRRGVTPRAQADAPIGEWNRFVITMKGDRVTALLNGTTVLEDARLPGIPASGPIGLQGGGGGRGEGADGGPIQFANIYVKELK